MIPSTCGCTSVDRSERIVETYSLVWAIGFGMRVTVMTSVGGNPPAPGPPAGGFAPPAHADTATAVAIAVQNRTGLDTRTMSFLAGFPVRLARRGQSILP